MESSTNMRPSIYNYECKCGIVIQNISIGGHIKTNRHMRKLRENYPNNYLEIQAELMKNYIGIQRTKTHKYCEEEVRKYDYPELLNVLPPRIRVLYIPGHPDQVYQLEFDRCFMVK